VVGNAILRPALLALTTHSWRGGEHVPGTGGCILAINHVSHADPVVTADFVMAHGRLPRYLAKSNLFRVNRFVTWVLTSAGQIPVERLTPHAVGAYDAAVQAVAGGECLVVYPEGTLTRDPDLWPMRGKSGAARIALATGAPVIPVAQWGAQELLPPYSKRLRVWRRTRVKVSVGPRVDLEDLMQRGPTPAVVTEATDRIMAAIVALLEELRGGQAPAERFDPRKAGLRLIGNPHENPQQNPHVKRRRRKKDKS
jgi:1-acyl-sn-glycerol-3-phosphate acyltransferase